MPERSDIPRVRLLERALRMRAGWPLRSARYVPALGWLVVVALVAPRMVDGVRAVDCAAAVREAPSMAVAVCQREYDRTRDPMTGVRLADTLRLSQELPRAADVARTLLFTSARSEALRVLGNVARTEKRFDDAAGLLEVARTEHRLLGDRVGLVRDDQALATVQHHRNQHTGALLALDECITEARAAAEPELQYICHLDAVSVLIDLGLLDLARKELDLARKVAGSIRGFSDYDRVLLEYTLGNLEQEYDRGGLHISHNKQAIAAFRRGIALNRTAKASYLAVSFELNLAWSLAADGDFDDAARHLEVAAELDVDNRRELDRIPVVAELAYRRGDLVRAAALNDSVYDRAEDDPKIDIATMQARIALAHHDLPLAETWAKRGVDKVEELRAAQSTLELRPGILSIRRAPYELWFVALARAGKVEDALMAFDQWQGRTMLDALVTPGARVSGDLRAAAHHVANLDRWLPVASQASLARLTDRRAVRDTLGQIDLLALLVAEGHVWCLTARRGALRVHDLGPLAALQDRFERFVRSPTERALASELGALILRDGTAYPTTAALRVILDGSLAALPVAALRTDGPLVALPVAALHDQHRPLIAMRPVLRVSRLPEVGCVKVERPTHMTVLADAFGDLPHARAESALAKLLSLDTTTSVGPAATSEALFAATSHDLVHLAVHATVDAGNGVLELRDRDVPALEISARKLGAPLVVLSACGSARSTMDDLELAGSLATAFLAAGSPQVIATLRPVSDAGAAELTTRFYRDGGLADPVRTLAAVQAGLAQTNDNADWPYFAVFGDDLCLQH